MMMILAPMLQSQPHLVTVLFYQKLELSDKDLKGMATERKNPRYILICYCQHSRCQNLALFELYLPIMLQVEGTSVIANCCRNVVIWSTSKAFGSNLLYLDTIVS